MLLSFQKKLLLVVARFEAFDTTGGVHQALLAGVKRVRVPADVDVNHEVVDIADLPGLARRHRRVGHDLVRAVDEDDGVQLGVDFSFHSPQPGARRGLPNRCRRAAGPMVGSAPVLSIGICRPKEDRQVATGTRHSMGDAAERPGRCATNAGLNHGKGHAV